MHHVYAHNSSSHDVLLTHVTYLAEPLPFSSIYKVVMTAVVFALAVALLALASGGLALDNGKCFTPDR